MLLSLTVIEGSQSKGSQSKGPGKPGKKEDMMSVDNSKKTIFHRLVEEVWHQGKIEVIDELFPPDHVVHSPTGEVIGPEGFKRFYEEMTGAFSDIKMKIVQTVSEGDLCMARFEFYARHTGEFMKIAPTGKNIRVTGHSMARIKNGRFVEGWDEFDLYGMMVQMGAVPKLGE